MKTQTVGGVHLVESTGCFNLLPRKPLAVSAGELQFVAVLVDMFGAKDRTHFRQFDLADTGEVIHDLLLFVLELLVVRKDLPFASTAHTEMLASGFTTHRTRLYQSQHFCLHETMFLLGDLQVHDVARYAVGYKGYDVVDAHQCFPFGSDTGDLDILKNR